jgi:hypothetical protein
MKKIIFILALSISLQTSFAQLGALKAKKNETAAEIVVASATTSEGYQAISNLAEVFDNNVLFLKDFTVDISDPASKAVIESNMNQRFNQTKWNFFGTKDIVRVTNKINAVSKEFKFTAKGNKVQLEYIGEKWTGEMFAKGNRIRFVATYNNESSPDYFFVFEKSKKAGRDVYTFDELAKFSFTFYAANDDFHKSLNPAIHSPAFSADYSDYWYYNKTGTGKIDLYKIDNYTDASTGEFKKVELWDLDFSKVDANNFKAIYADGWDTYIQIPLKSAVGKITYDKGEKAVEQTTKTIVMQQGILKAQNADETIEFLAKNFSPAQLAIFNANTAKRKADLAVRVAWEKKEYAKFLAEQAAKRAKMAEIQVNGDGYEVTIEEHPVAGADCKWTYYTFDYKTKTRTILFCVGSTIKEKRTGRTLFVVTKAMDGGKYKISY